MKKEEQILIHLSKINESVIELTKELKKINILLISDQPEPSAQIGSHGSLEESTK